MCPQAFTKTKDQRHVAGISHPRLISASLGAATRQVACRITEAAKVVSPWQRASATCTSGRGCAIPFTLSGTAVPFQSIPVATLRNPVIAAYA
jgi:hypothetical protein